MGLKVKTIHYIYGKVQCKSQEYICRGNGELDRIWITIETEIVSQYIEQKYNDYT